jgi:hypothetical protein
MAMNQKPSARVPEVISILLYGAAALVIGGGAGIYVPLLMGKEAGVDTFATYAFAILAPAFLDALFETYWRDLQVVQQMLIGFLCFAAAALAGGSLLLKENHPLAMPAALLATTLVLIVWFVMSLVSGRFRRSNPPPKGSLGGANPNKSTLGGEGIPS